MSPTSEVMGGVVVRVLGEGVWLRVLLETLDFGVFISL